MGVNHAKRQERSRKKLQSYVNRCLRYIFGICGPNVISIEDVWVRTKQKEICKEIRYRKWKWIVHILRKENENIAKKALEWKRKRKKKRKTQDYMAKHSENGSRTSREELTENKSSEQEQDPMTSFHKGPLPLRGLKGHITTYIIRKLNLLISLILWSDN
jgi:hypothetical protein